MGNSNAKSNDKHSTTQHFMNLGTSSAAVHGWLWRWVWGWSWRPTSPRLLRNSESRMLSLIRSDYWQRAVKIEAHDQMINTLQIGQGPPLLLLHGFAAGVGHWACNIDELAKEHTVFAIDLPGFGRSSRPYLRLKTAEEAEEYFLTALEEWREKIGLEKFTLLGHSFGGYLAACYSMKHPQRVQNLILCEPWGIPRKDPEREYRIPLRWRIFIKISSWFSPLATIRFAGPYGPLVIHRLRPDLTAKWTDIPFEGKESDAEEEITDRSTELPPVVQYIYHSNAQVPATGEQAFAELSIPIGWAKAPLCDRLMHISPSIPILFLYGEKTWMDKSAAEKLMKRMENETKLILVAEAGHHLYVDNYTHFNQIVLRHTAKEFEKNP